MSDSDESTNNVFTFQNGNATVSARGPNINASNIGLSFRSNVMTSTMNLPRNFDQRYAETSYDQRSMYYKRHKSPMSVHSACAVRMRNFPNFYYSGGMSSQHSIINGRSGSPMSFRSADTNASVSATDIALAFKNAKFNKYDLRVISDAYNKYMKSRVRKRIEKRRKLRLFHKGTRCMSGYDSGEQGSNSSISSDDCRSIKTTGFKESMSSCRSMKPDLTDLKKTINESTMYRDCTENVRQNTLRNMVTVGQENLNKNKSQNNPQNFPTYTLKDRFKNGFLLPSHRFNRSVATSAIPENLERITSNNKSENNKKPVGASATCETDSEQEEIFADVTVKENTTHNIGPNRKRSIDNDDVCLPERKRSKISPIYKENTKAKTVKNKQTEVNTGSNPNDFVFAKPSFPIKKSANIKTSEKLISKSSQPLLDNNLSKNASNTLPSTSDEKEGQVHDDEPEIKQISTSDVSMRPSFIKRKLFTQKLDVTENKNSSCDSLAANSPQAGVYGAIQNEKHKARKLVTQSCLRRKVEDDNNLMDLIYKIVPPDHMNATNRSNKTEVNKKNVEDLDDKWDVTSIISTCNNDNVSDTYTDEEILEPGNNANIIENVSIKPIQNVEASRCKILLDKLPANILREQQSKQNTAMENNQFMKKPVQTKSFWDTDFESENECQITSHSKGDLKGNYDKANKLKGAKCNSILNKNAPVTEITTTPNNTLDSVQKLNVTSLRTRSHRSPKRKKCCYEMRKPEEIKSTVPQINKQGSKQNPKASPKAPQPRSIEKNNNNVLNKPNVMDSTLNVTNKKTKEVDDSNKRKPRTKNNTKALNKHNELNSTPGKKNNTGTCLENTNKRKQNSTKNDSTATSLENNKKRKLNSTKNDSSETDLENSNVSGRPIRSCRTSKQNKTLDAAKINQSIDYNFNLSIRSLRSRQIDLSSSFNKEKNTNTSKKKASNNSRVLNKSNQTKLRQSKISFSLVSDKSALLNKKASTNKTGQADSRVSKNREMEISDVSFSLTADKEPSLSKTSSKGKATLAKNLSEVSINTILSKQNEKSLNKRPISEAIVKSSRRIMIKNQKGIK